MELDCDILVRHIFLFCTGRARHKNTRYEKIFYVCCSVSTAMVPPIARVAPRQRFQTLNVNDLM